VHRIGRTGRAGASGLAITLVTREDNRLIADIEKLIKKKIELEPLELDDDRPRRDFRADRPPRRPDDEARDGREGRSAPRSSGFSYAAPKAVLDPFFERPYEASTSAEPAWESKAAASTPAPRGLSPNIKPKRKVAALFGGKAD
jgi:superfamily II DNA/RNA helicase